MAESLAETMSWFRAWLDEVAPYGRPVLLVGALTDAAPLLPGRRYSLPIESLGELVVDLAHGQAGRSHSSAAGTS